MNQNIGDFVTASAGLVALGEPTHQEPAFGLVRNELFAQLADRGFRSIALETDLVAALTVNDFVQDGVGTLDTAMSDGFSHGFGDLAPNRQLVAWMREYNEGRPSADRLAFYGFDAATEMMSAPSPRRYLEHARDYLGLDANFADIASLAGEDVRWSRTEAIMDAAMSVGATAEADKLRSIADDMLTWLYARAPELVAATSRAEWFRARTHLTAGLGLLRYHRQSAQPLDQNERIFRLSSVRDALMAQHLLDLRDIEASRGATLVFAQNLHLQRNASIWSLGDMHLNWFGAGAILASLVDGYTFVAGSLGRSDAIGLGEPEPDTYEGFLQRDITTWGLTTEVASASTRTDTTPPQGYFPLDKATVDGADVILHISAGAPAQRPPGTFES
jgi:erythromycin esterase-like protein